jgi:LPS export ABC transporter protein LptC/lipopolysaccharide transport protein LptA
MRLERIFTHRLISALRLVLPIFVLALAAIPAWNYFAKRVPKSNVKLGRQLPTGVSVHTEGFTYARTEGGRTVFIVHARQSLGYKDNKYMLEDVDVTVNGSTEKDPPKTIRGKNCTYDQETSDFQCDGKVEVQLDEKTIVRTDELIYNHRDGVVTAPRPATVEQAGATGRANNLEYGLNSGLLKMNGDVKIVTEDHTEVETAAALFQQKENWTTMSGGVLIKSANGWIRGSTGRAGLEPGTYKPRMITVDGNVTAESHPQAGRDAWKLRAGWIESTMSPTGDPEMIKTRGNVEVEKIAGDMHQRLTGGEIDATLKDGRIGVIVARQNARMVLGSDQTLEAAQIWTNGSGSIQTTDKSVLSVGDSTIEGHEFTIENGEDIVTFNTSRQATLKSGDRVSSADRTEARFDGRTNMLLKLVQSGNFQFRTPQYDGHAQSGQFEDGGTVVTLEGSPVVNDSQKRLEAGQIRLNQKDNGFVATKNVSTFIKNPVEPVLVKAGRAEGGADSVVYTGNVQLWRGDAYIKADRLDASGQGLQNNRLHAEALPGGHVQSNLQAIRATSDKLDYDDARGSARYTGHVRAQKQDMIVETPDMTVSFRDKNVTEIVASGGVAVTRADQRGTGERAVYDAATDVVTLTGKNAQVRDKEHGLVQGPTLTMKNKGASVSVESGNGERTVTKHPIKMK